MSELQQMFDKLKVSSNYGENAAMLTVLLNSFTRGNKPVTNEDLIAITGFIFDEMKKLIKLIPQTSSYKLKDEICDYEDKLMGLFMCVTAQKHDVGKDNVKVVNDLVNVVATAQAFEIIVDEIFKLDKIDTGDVNKVLNLVKSFTDEYQRGKIYSGLHYHEDAISKITDDARANITKFISEEFTVYLKKKGKLTDDAVNNLEIAVDVCKFFIDEKIIVLLKEILKLKYSNIRYYAIETLLFAKQEIDAEIVAEMASDLTYAELTYHALKKYGRESLFPKEFTTPEYLAKSDMVHWLIFPTELGKAPDEIELLGSVKVRKTLYYVFKYKSDSDNLGDVKGEWLVGWSSDDGGTFSNFDELSEFEQKNPAKTLKVIKKRLLG